MTFRLCRDMAVWDCSAESDSERGESNGALGLLTRSQESPAPASGFPVLPRGGCQGAALQARGQSGRRATAGEPAGSGDLRGRRRPGGGVGPSRVADLARIGKMSPEVVEMLRAACRAFLADDLQPRPPINVEAERVQISAPEPAAEAQPTSGGAAVIPIR